MSADEERAVARRVYARAAVAGAVCALVIEMWLLVSGGRFFGYEPLGDVFDAQARSLLDGRWDIPPDVIKIEGFEIGGRTYTYFGPVPALLRMPVVALTDAFDGRLTRLSLLLAWGVTLAASARLAWRLRRFAADAGACGSTVTRREQVLVALWVFAIGAGSSVTYLASRPSVFHEATAWGVAIAIVGLDAVLAWRRSPSLFRFAVVVALCTAALLTRASVGAAPAIAAGLALAVESVRDLRRRDLRHAAAGAFLASSLAIPLIAYAAVNHARFGTLFTLPYEHHVVTKVVEHRRDVLAANGGTIQGLHFVPTTGFHFVRPDAIGFDRAYPWIDFPARATVIGDVVMDQIDVASSVPSSMPALTAAAIVGAGAIARRRALRVAWPLVAGGAACLIVTLAIGFVAQRYTADAVPLLVVAGAAALPALARVKRGNLLVAAAAVLVAFSVVVTAALTIQFQQHYGFLTPKALRADLAATQLRLPHAGDPGRVTISEGQPLPNVGAEGEFVVIGACAGLYRSDGVSWQPVEGTPAVGHHRVRAPVRSRAVALPEGVVLQRRGDRVIVRRGDAPARAIRTTAAAIELEIDVDRLVGFVDVRHRGETVLTDFFLGDAAPPRAVDQDVEVLPTPTPVCDELTGRSS